MQTERRVLDGLVRLWRSRHQPDALRPAPAVAPPASAAPSVDCHGWLTEVSAQHVGGWVQSRTDPAQRVGVTVMLTGTGEVLARGTADQFRHGLGIGDGAHGFQVRLPRMLDPAEQAQLAVVPDGAVALARVPAPKTAFEPILHVAMDIVDNCNLRCPFCLYDYAETRTTHLMSEATIAAALRLLPYTRDGEFWFSCLHEPTLHPQLMAFIDQVPREYRRKLFYTTNVAKRMPAAYYAWLADSGLHHLNISIESLQPALYERMRKGARHPIFREGWDALLAAFAAAAAPPRLRYITMVYKSNLAEIPELVRTLLDECHAWQVELRYTYDVPHLPPGFRESEFLDDRDWADLRTRLADYPPDRVQLLSPPPAAAVDAPDPAPPASTAGAVLPDYYLFRMSWDGSLRVFGIDAASRHDHAIEVRVAEINVRDIADPASFIEQLNALPAPALTH